MTDLEELEFLSRQYKVVTDELVALLERVDDEDVPPSIKAALDQLASAINGEWG